MSHTDTTSPTPRTSLARRRLVLLASAAAIAVGAFAVGAGYRPPALPIAPAHAAPVSETAPTTTARSSRAASPTSSPRSNRPSSR